MSPYNGGIKTDNHIRPFPLVLDGILALRHHRARQAPSRRKPLCQLGGGMMACDGGKRQFQFISVYGWFADFPNLFISPHGRTHLMWMRHFSATAATGAKPLSPPLHSIPSFFPSFSLFLGPTLRAISHERFMLSERGLSFSQGDRRITLDVLFCPPS